MVNINFLQLSALKHVTCSTHDPLKHKVTDPDSHNLKRFALLTSKIYLLVFNFRELFWWFKSFTL